jgi:thioredoxin reductase (NADPH)
MKAHVIDALDYVGGQCTALYPEKPIYDLPGFPAIDAQDLINNLEQQAKPFDPTYHLGQQVVRLEKVGENWVATTSKGTVIEAKAVMIAAGCGAFGPNRPPIEGLEAYEKSGAVAYMVQQKELYRDKRVVIAGGGDSAVDWALSLADIANSVQVVHRRPKFRCAPDSAEKLKQLAADGKVEMVIPFQLDNLKGENGKLDAVIVKDLEGNIRELEADHLLPFYGLAMELGPIANWGLGLHMNHINVNPTTCATNVEGIFAIGDINHYENKLKLIVCGFSEAAMAAKAAYPFVHAEPYHFEYSTSKGV